MCGDIVNAFSVQVDGSAVFQRLNVLHPGLALHYKLLGCFTRPPPGSRFCTDLALLPPDDG
jgi:hypothetical protein